jgi:hypothetical protein
VTPAPFDEASVFRTRFNDVLTQVDDAVLPAGGHSFRIDQANRYGDTAVLQPLFERLQTQFTIRDVLLEAPESE